MRKVAKLIVDSICNNRGRIFRGVSAVAILIIITIAMLIDVFSGNSESFEPWLFTILGSALLTVISYMIRKSRQMSEKNAQENIMRERLRKEEELYRAVKITENYNKPLKEEDEYSKRLKEEDDYRKWLEDLEEDEFNKWLEEQEESEAQSYRNN